MKEVLLSLLPTRLYLEAVHLESKLRYSALYRKLQDQRLRVTDSDYSFLPFDESRSIFVHVPKCAGVSVCRTLYGNLAGGHTTLREYTRIFEPARLLEYFKFTIVRNPWDRLVSAYHFLQGGGFDHRDAEWFESELSRFEDFDDFVRGWVNATNIWSWHHFRPQHHYMHDPKGRISVDFVVLLENLDEDLEVVRRRIEWHGSLPESNRSRHRPYSDYYTSDTRRIVAEVYARDIALLDYSFDNSSLARQIANRDRRGGLLWQLS